MASDPQQSGKVGGDDSAQPVVGPAANRTSHSGSGDALQIVRSILAPLASLKLTVILFAMSIFIVLAGTLAQVHMDIWEVVHSYFRMPAYRGAYTWNDWGWFDAMFAEIQWKIFFPKSFLPDMPDYAWLERSFYFPKGWLIGAMMMVNLLAAHLVRFRVQARGNRLASGLVVLAIGIFLTYGVIHSGSFGDEIGVQDAAWLEWTTVWTLVKVGLAVLWFLLAARAVTMGGEQRVLRVAMIVAAALYGAGLIWLFLFGHDFKPGDSSMRILWQLVKATGAGVVLLAGCILVFRQRAGIVLLHAGVGLLMLSELLVGVSAVETQFWAQDGQMKNFTEDRRTVELAVVDSSDQDTDHVVVVPKNQLLSGETISDDALPFDVRVVDFLPHAPSFRAVAPGEVNPATTGIGLREMPVPARRSVGTDTDAAFDMPAAYVEFTDKQTQKSLGTHLLSVVAMLDWDDARTRPEKVTVGDKTYNVALRYERAYKPFWIEVVDARQDNYAGTQMARNYSSDVRLIDNDGRELLSTHIWMNNPLRFAGETYYQSGFVRQPTGDVTTLQVVTNRGWMIPYVSCMIVAVGSLFQFGASLVRFVRRRARELPASAIVLEEEFDPKTGKPIIAAAVSPADPRQASSGKRRDRREKQFSIDGGVKSTAKIAAAGDRSMSLYVALGVAALAVLTIAYGAAKRQAPYEEMDLAAFGALPVMDHGRVKPYDTLARSTLRVLAKQETFKDTAGDRQPAIRWLLDVIAGDPAADKHRVFKIENFDLQTLLNVEPRSGYLYSLEEIQPRLPQLGEAAQAAHETERSAPDKVTLLQRKIVDFEQRLRAFLDIRTAFEPVDLPPMPKLDGELDEATQRQAEFTQKMLLAMRDRQDQLVEGSKPPLPVPAERVESKDGAAAVNADMGAAWETLTSARLSRYIHENYPKEITAAIPKPSEASRQLGDILAAYKAKNASKFNDAVGRYSDWMANLNLVEYSPSRARYETFFNGFAPFYLASWLYLLVFVLAALSWLAWHAPFRWAAFSLALVTLALHTFALVSRIYISGRPPVTTLYSSAVFISFGCVALALILEAVFRLGIGSAVAGACGAGALLISHFLSYDSGDTFPVLVAVLDTQFWLATHVVCVTMGYATTFLAGVLGIFYVGMGVCTPALDKSVGKSLARMTYGSLCFALFFSFVGTVLGGLWADDSWGRFWGWDPKENGALIIVLWNALILHARWDGMVKDRGLAVLAIFGNIVTSWSWFGTNELRVGLHSYGFTEGMVFGLFVSWGVHMALIALGSIPKQWWWSEIALRQQAKP